jgi:hypothetical protein
MSLLVVGSVALDSVQTPFGRADDALGGSATYFAAAGSLSAIDAASAGRNWLASWKMNTGAVRVFPARFPEISTTLPNSPMHRANVRFVLQHADNPAHRLHLNPEINPDLLKHRRHHLTRPSLERAAR